MILLFIANSVYGFTHLTPETSAAFDRYVQNAEARMNRDLQPDRFLHMNASPDIKAKLRGGEVRIESGATLSGGKEAKEVAEAPPEEGPPPFLPEPPAFVFVPILSE